MSGGFTPQVGVRGACRLSRRSALIVYLVTLFECGVRWFAQAPRGLAHLHPWQAGYPTHTEGGACLVMLDVVEIIPAHFHRLILR